VPESRAGREAGESGDLPTAGQDDAVRADGAVDDAAIGRDRERLRDRRERADRALERQPAAVRPACSSASVGPSSHSTIAHRTGPAGDGHAQAPSTRTNALACCDSSTSASTAPASSGIGSSATGRRSTVSSAR